MWVITIDYIFLKNFKIYGLLNFIWRGNATLSSWHVLCWQALSFLNSCTEHLGRFLYASCLMKSPLCCQLGICVSLSTLSDSSSPLTFTYFYVARWVLQCNLIRSRRWIYWYILEYSHSYLFYFLALTTFPLSLAPWVKFPMESFPPQYPSIQHSGHIAISQREPRQGSRFTFSLTIEIHLVNKFYLIACEVTPDQAFRQSWLVSRHDLLLLLPLLHLTASTVSNLLHTNANAILVPSTHCSFLWVPEPAVNVSHLACLNLKFH